MTDFFKFDRYLTPSVIRIFYGLQLILIGLFTLAGVGAGLIMMSRSLFAGLLYVIFILFSAAVGLLAARILTEVVMVFFQNNDHLAAIRARMEGGAPTV